MRYIRSQKSGFLGMGAALIAVSLFSVNDVVVKFLSGGYALHQMILIRSGLGFLIVMALILPLTGGLRNFRTRYLGRHIIRALFVVFANMMFFLGLAALPLAETVALFFISPLLITVFSVIFLGEYVGRHRWGAIFLGLIGVVVMVRPGTDAFQLASLLPLAAAFGYAALHIMTRKMGVTESAVTMTIYIQMTFFVVCLLIGLAIGNGRFAAQEDPSLAFLFRAWDWPLMADAPLFLAIALASAFGGFFISVAYRDSEAALIAPVEYIALPLSLLWGYLFFDEWPDGTAMLGMALIFAAGLYLIWREALAKSS